jgi:transcriptional regulator with XRE-family HTH domain
MNTLAQQFRSDFNTQKLLPFVVENNMSDTEPMALADRIRAILAELPGPEYGKQARLAKIAGCGRPAVNNWLTGQQRIAADHALAISNALGYRIEWLVEGKGPRKKGEKESDLPEAADALYVTHVTPKEMEMLSAYRSADATGRSFIETAWKFVAAQDHGKKV